jgi:hypothetical protein
MKTVVLSFILILLALTGSTQETYYTKNATISFFSSTLIEDIEAVNHEAVSFLKTDGSISFGVMIKSFKFENGLMQDHFNENYMESEKFPKALFEGTITNIESVNFKEDGTYPIEIKGKMTIHGVSQMIDTKSAITVKSGKIKGAGFLRLRPEDYGIVIPALVSGNIAEIIDVNISAEYIPYEK